MSDGTCNHGRTDRFQKWVKEEHGGALFVLRSLLQELLISWTDRQLGEESGEEKKSRSTRQNWRSQTCLKVGVVSQHRPTAKLSDSQVGRREEGGDQSVWSPIPHLM